MYVHWVYQTHSDQTHSQTRYTIMTELGVHGIGIHTGDTPCEVHHITI